MNIHFLGTNGWYNTATGQTSCVLIDAEEATIILDAGNGLQKIDDHITTDKPIYLFLSHFHLDHTYGLHTLPKFHFKQGITIIGQAGSRKYLGQLINRPWTCPIDQLRTPVSIHEVEEGEHQQPIPFKCRFLIHADPTLGFRFKLEGKSVSYCTDTGVCDAAVDLGEEADLLITECAWKERNQFAPWPHLAPEDAADMAKAAKAKRLALMHFDARNYPTHESRLEAEGRAQAIFPATHAMSDDQVIEL